MIYFVVRIIYDRRYRKKGLYRKVSVVKIRKNVTMKQTYLIYMRVSMLELSRIALVH